MLVLFGKQNQASPRGCYTKVLDNDADQDLHAVPSNWKQIGVLGFFSDIDKSAIKVL